MAFNCATFSLISICFLLVLGLILSSIGTSSCKLVKRSFDNAFDDDRIDDLYQDTLEDAWPFSDDQFGLFQWNNVTVIGDIIWNGNDWEYNSTEECSDDWGEVEFDGAHKAAQAFGVLTPIWAFSLLILLSVGLFCVKFPRCLHIVTVSLLLPLTFIFQLAVFNIYGSDGCIGTPFDYDEFYDESTDSPYDNKYCEPDEGTYFMIGALISFLIASILGCVTCCVDPHDSPICCNNESAGCCNTAGKDVYFNEVNNNVTQSSNVESNAQDVEVIDQEHTTFDGGMLPVGKKSITVETINPDGSKTVTTTIVDAV